MASRRRTFVVVGLVSIVVVGLVALALRPEKVPVDLVSVTSGLFERRVAVDGRTRTRERYVVSAPMPGIVGRIGLDPGDAVDERTIVATLAPVEPPLLDTRTRAELTARLRAAKANKGAADAQLARVEASTRFAKAEVGRIRALVEAGSVAARDLEQAAALADASAHELEASRFAARMAAHDVELAKAALARSGGRNAGDETCCELRSPVRGKVLRVQHESEGVVAAGTPLLEVGDPADLEIVADVLTTDAVRVGPGAPVRIERWGGEPVLEGRVRRVEPSAVTKVSALGVEEQRVDVIIDLVSPREQWGSLADGFRVEVAILTERLEDAVKVPTSALFRVGDAWAVFVAERGRALRREVELGPRSPTEAVVTKGLSPGERIVVHPSDAVDDGVRIAER